MIVMDMSPFIKLILDKFNKPSNDRKSINRKS